MYRRKNKIYAPVEASLIIDFISIPIMVYSGGASGAIQNRFSNFIVSSLTKTSIEKLSGHAVKSGIIWGGSKIASSVVGSLAFTVLYRLGMSTATLGVIPIYDPKKSLYDNYAKEIAYASVLFFFLPMAEPLNRIFANWAVSRAVFKGRPFAKDLSYRFFHATPDSIIFDSFPYLLNYVKNVLQGTNDPLYKNNEEKYSQLARSIAISLAFRI